MARRPRGRVVLETSEKHRNPSVPQTPKLRHSPEDYHSPQEAHEALDKLSQAEIERLVNCIHFRILGGKPRCGPFEAEDLFVEAAERTLDDIRGWRRGITLFNHLLAVSKSIADHRGKQERRMVPLDHHDHAIRVKAEWKTEIDAHHNISRLFEQLRAEDDAIAQQVLETVMDEIPPRKALQLLGIEQDVYDAARKRIYRRVLKLRHEFGREKKA